MVHVALAAAIGTAVLFRFCDARERCCNQRALQAIRRACWWHAGGSREDIDQFQNEEAGKGTTKVGDAMGSFEHQHGLYTAPRQAKRVREAEQREKADTYVARRVM